MQQIDNLTGLRAFSALAVLIYHVRYPPLADRYGQFAFLFNNGVLGVQVFFILSGFILAYVHRGEFQKEITPHAVRSFLWARLARIYPVHLFMLIAVAFVLPGLRLYHGWAPNDTWTALFSNVLLVHAWGIFPGILTFNQASWSISAEWFAYLCFPLIVFLTRRWLLWLPLALIAILIIPHVFYTVGIGAPNCVVLFTIGICTFIIGERLPKSWLWRAGGILIGPLLIFLLWFQVQHFHNIFVISTALLILCLFKGGPVFFYANPVSVYLGRISYSIYMSHIITFTMLRLLTGGIMPLRIEVPAVLIVAALIYHLVEQPARDLMRRQWKDPPAVKPQTERPSRDGGDIAEELARHTQVSKTT